MLEIRRERDGDAPGIREVLRAAFGGDDEAILVDALRASGNLAISLVAFDAGHIVGHIAFSPVMIDGHPGGLGLAPLAVLPDRQRTGIGSAMIRNGLEEARGSGYVVVLGHPQYYAKFGFRRAGELGLQNVYGADDAFRVLEIRPGSIPAGGGLVRYGSEFGTWG